MNAPGSDAKLRALKRAILEHLESRPHAADSADGVARCWLWPRGAAASESEIGQALAEMVARGVLRRVDLADGTTLYSKGRTGPQQ